MTREEKLALYGEGPWLDEPDRVEWRHLGFPCLIRRARGGNLCGYVAVPPGHPWHGRSAREVDNHVSVHGGVNSAKRCDDEPDGVCHVPAPGEPEDVYWLGFDCAHVGSGDLQPALHKLFGDHFALARTATLFGENVYRNVAYVRDEVEALARQAAQAKTLVDACANKTALDARMIAQLASLVLLFFLERCQPRPERVRPSSSATALRTHDGILLSRLKSP